MVGSTNHCLAMEKLQLRPEESPAIRNYGERRHVWRDREKRSNVVVTRCSSRGTLLTAVLTLLLAVAIITVCVGAVYIRHLQDTGSDVDHEKLEVILRRLDTLERKLAACSCQQSDEQINLDKVHSGTEAGARVKRHTNTSGDLVESNHIKNEHHGIASSHIALLYGDPAQLNATSQAATGPNPVVRFRNSTTEGPHCSRVLENGKDDRWCLPQQPASPHKFLMWDTLNFYSYFAKAPWMNEPRSLENFIITGDDRRTLQVNKGGIYIVATSMHFVEMPTSRVHYGVYASDRYDRNERLLSVCTVSVHASMGGIYPCPTWQLTPLNPGDRVFMKINGYNWFRVEKETFFIALIKLNDWTL